MLKKSIGIVFLLIAGNAYSGNIIVSTSEDVIKNDNQCSLREAIEYVNQGLPEAGYFGCGGKDSTNIIILQKKTTYTLKNQHIKISKPLEVLSVYAENDEPQNPVIGLHNATIKMNGNDNIFRIDDLEKTAFQVKLTEINLEGCGTTACRVKQGGLVFNNEHLILQYVKLFKGFAEQGGAIFNNTAPDDANFSAARLEVSNSLFEANTANEGGIVYGYLPQFLLNASVFKANTTLNNQSANIYTNNGLSKAPTEKEDFTQVASAVFNSTFLENKGYIFNLKDNIGANNITVIGNQKGILLDSKYGKAFVANSVILANPNPVSTERLGCVKADPTNDKSVLQNNLVDSSCNISDVNYPNYINNETSIIAGNVISSQEACKTLSEDGRSLFCPYILAKDSFLGYFRPRILSSAKVLEDVAVINKGQAAKLDAPLVACQNLDQRGISRPADNINCDLGAIEIVVPDTSSLIGKDLRPGEVASFNINDLLGDSDLVPKEMCDALPISKPQGQAWQAGCLQIEQVQTQSKGRLEINENGNLVYRPDSAWHGADVFNIKVVTTSTRFNTTSPYLTVRVQIIQAPKNEMKSKKTSTSGGSFGVISVIALLGLIHLRRKKII